MGNCDSCAGEEGNPILLTFDCISLGTHEINVMDNLKLKNATDELARRLGISSNKIGDIYYNQNRLDKYTRIKDLNLPPGATLIVKFGR